MSDQVEAPQRRASDTLLERLTLNIEKLTAASAKHEKEIEAVRYEIKQNGREILSLQEEQRRINDRIESHWAIVQAASGEIANCVSDGFRKHQLMTLATFVMLFIVVLAALFGLWRV